MIYSVVARSNRSSTVTNNEQKQVASTIRQRSLTQVKYL